MDIVPLERKAVSIGIQVTKPRQINIHTQAITTPIAQETQETALQNVAHRRGYVSVPKTIVGISILTTIQPKITMHQRI